MKTFELLGAECSYDLYGKVAAVVPECGGLITGSEFTDKVTLSLRVLPELRGALEKRLADATAGRVTLVKTGETVAEG